MSVESVSGKEEKGNGKDEAYQDKVCEYVWTEVGEDADDVQHGSVAWPCCLWCWCSLTRLVLDHAGVDVLMC